MSSESLKSLIVTDPDLVDPELDVSGLRTQTDTDPRLLASIADFPGISYDPTQFSYLTDLNELFAYGLPLVDTGTTTPETGTGGGGTGDGGQATLPGTIDSIITPSANTPEEQRLIDEGIGLQIAPGDPVVAPGEIPVTQQQLDDFNQIPVTPVNEFTTGDASLAEQIAAEDRAAQLANVQDPTTMLPQLGTDTPTVFDDTATLEDAGAGEGGMQLAEVGLGDEADFTPSSTYDEAGLQIAEAPFGINPATGEPYQTPRTIADQNRVLGVVTEQDLIDNTSLAQKLGLPADFDVKAAAIKAGINLAVGVPITLIAEGLGAILPSGISTTTNKAREAGLLVGDSTVTQDKYGINTQSQFGDYNQYNVDQVEKLENKLEELRTDKYKDDFQAYLDNTKRMRTELEERKNYLKISGADGDIDERDQMLEDIVLQNKIDEGIQAADDDKGDDMLDTTGVNPFKDIDTGVGEFDTGTNIVDEVALTGGDTPNIIEDIGIENIQESIDRAVDQNIIDRGGGDDIGSGGLDPNRGQQVDRGSSGAGDDRPVTGTTKPGELSTSTYDAELEDERDVGGGGNDGGGSPGGGKIVCTMMNESYGFGSFRNKIWMKFHKDLSPEYQKGYHKLFLPLVRIAKKNIIVKKVLEHIAVHSTIDMRQSMRGKTHLLGRIYRKILLPLCYWVGKNG